MCKIKEGGADNLAHSSLCYLVVIASLGIASVWDVGSTRYLARE